MGLLSKLRNAAHDFLSARPAPRVAQKNAVTQDNFDADVFAGCLKEVPPLRNLVEELTLDYGNAEAMVRDVMQLFWQSSPTVHDVAEMDERFLLNHAVATDVQNAPDTERLRSMTRLDKYGATMATLSVSEDIKAFLKKQDDLKDELEEAAKKAEEARQEAEKAADALKEAQQAADGADDEYDGIGPLTQAQSEAQDALEAALEAAAAAAGTSDGAQGALQDVAGKAASRADKMLRDAVEAAVEKLEEEMDMFRAWGMNDGEIKRLSIAERMALAARMRNSRMAKWMKFVGRKRLAASATRTQRTQYGRDEVVGVELSGDLSRVLPSELVLAHANRLLGLDFLRRLDEGEVLSRQFVGNERLRQGAIVFCEDESQSMTALDKHGISREAWAKATGLCMWDQAKAEKRDFVWIAFSTASQLKAHYFPGGQATVVEMMDVVEHFFNGGTDFMAPLTMAAKILNGEYEKFKAVKGDIVFVTDDDCRVTPSWLLDFNEAKRQLDFKLYGVFCGVPERSESHLALMSDHTHYADEFADPDDIAGMVRTI